MTTAAVNLWGTTIGYVSMDTAERFARFEYDPDYATKGVKLAPLMMPLKAHQVYQFSNLPKHSFYGLPGLLADSLPDKYGNKLIDVWLAQKGRTAESFNAVDFSVIMGARMMSAYCSFISAPPPASSPHRPRA